MSLHVPILPHIVQDGDTDPEQNEADAKEAVLDAFAYVRSSAAHTHVVLTDSIVQAFPTPACKTAIK